MNIEKPYQSVPVSFKGNWTLEQEEPIIQIILENDSEYFEMPFYNYWSFSMLSDGFIIAKRATWDMGTLNGNNIDEIVFKLKEYYKKN